MRGKDSVRSGSVIRLTTPYMDATRGNYAVVHVYRNGWLGIQSLSNGLRHDVPAYLCRFIGSISRREGKSSDT